MEMLRFHSYYSEKSNILQFFYKKFSFSKNLFKSHGIAKRSKSPVILSHIKTCRSLKRSAILKIPSNLFRGTWGLSIGFKTKPPRGTVFLC